MAGKVIGDAAKLYPVSYYRDVYLKSEEWKTLRLVRLIKSGGLCACCNFESLSNDVHHLTYRKSLSEVDDNDLRVLCRNCHREVHRLLNEEPLLKLLPFRQRWRAVLVTISRQRADQIAGWRFGRSGWFPLMLKAAQRNSISEVSIIVNFIRQQRLAERLRLRTWRRLVLAWDDYNAGNSQVEGEFEEPLVAAIITPRSNPTQ